MNPQEKTKEDLLQELQELQHEFDSLKEAYLKQVSDHLAAELESKRIEEALFNERLLLRTLIDNIPDSIYSKDLEGRKTLANIAEILCVGADSEADVLGKDDFAFYPKEIAEDFVANDQMVFKTGKPSLNKEGYIFDRNGQKIWLLSSKLPLLNQEGQIIGIVGISRNITESKKTEELLFNKQLLLRTLIDIIPDSIYSKDLHSRKTLANVADVRNSGAKEESEVLGKDDFEVYPKELAERFFADDQIILKTGKPVLNRVEYVIDQNGQKRWLLSSKLPLYNQDGQIIGLVGVGRDITDRKFAEDALKQSKLLFQLLIESLPQNIYTKDAEGRFTFANQRFCSLQNKLLEDIIGKTDFDLYPPELAHKYCKDDRLVLDSGIAIELEEEHQSVDGKNFFAQVIKTPFYDAKEQAFGTLGIFWDITERKRVEQEIKLKNNQLLKANSDKDRFMSILAHDLRSPFNSILGFLQLLTENIRSYDLDTIELQLKIINDSAKNTYNLLEDILIWARSQSGKLPFDPIKINLASMCNDIIEILKPSADVKNISINHTACDDIVVWADIDMLKTILRNLISNAIKFTNNSGHIIISANQQGPMVTISVSDNGIGITQDIIDKLFDISKKHSTLGTANESGTGLGLILCKDFVEKHDGKIWVESQVEKGSTFKFTLNAKR